MSMYTVLGSSPDTPATPHDDEMADRIYDFNDRFGDHGLEAEWWRDAKWSETVHIEVRADGVGVLWSAEGEWDALDAFDAFEIRALDLMDAALARKEAA